MNLQDNISFLKHQLKNTTELLEKAEAEQAKELAKPKSKRILIKAHGLAYGLIARGNVDKYHSCDIIQNDNAFIDKESALLEAQRNTLVYRMRVAAAESPVDWSDKLDKFHPNWDCLRIRWNLSWANTFRYSQLPHFACKEKLKESMKSLSPEEQKLLICGVE
tara:strand:+ start:52 stop:540 length:489 start_codon:yes stop_codon:yes gene_type:complete